MMLARVEKAVQRFQLDLMEEDSGGKWNLGDVVIVGDCWEKAL